MSVHLSDRALLAQLIRLAETVLSRPYGVGSYIDFDLNAIAGDVVAAMRCRGNAARIGAFEGILFTALQTIITGGAATSAELARAAFIAQQALAVVRDHYGAIVQAEAARRMREFSLRGAAV